ncbi:hypothetical protein BO94DRAFT_473940 [Aspergillus sclerotioniger CBS 115572]|uniref:F-box domain-containing protein n=1 Tax=Aspergillus sclerotioniger CBS 115572 TaxID=1450535 RepID=A0A317VST9_9EURO|nr:hypothetical protein BO94DRAFT_473940 [Aspergillus sclerotioniger CBS 115572]PWY75992.1 hypothetical protein BO94DRAFT_473940 [Aspergillus sclerotioniger CBS 115572]
MSTSDLSWSECPSGLYALPPFCYICGSHSIGMPMDHAPLNGMSKNEHALFYSASEMEKIYSLNYAGWRTLYRMILYDPQEQLYCLSGIAQNALASPLQRIEYMAPWDEDDWVLNNRRKEGFANPRVILPSENIEAQTSLAGYLMHALCWRHLLRFINGPTSADDLRILSQTLIQHWVKGGVHESLSLPISRCNFNPDPLGINTIRKLVTECRKRAAMGVRIKRTALTTQCRLHTLPMELQYMIMDLLDCHDVCAMLRGINWDVGTGYWKHRLHRLSFDEIKSIQDEELDWRWLCLRLELLESSPTGGERRRFFEVLRGIGAQYDAAREEH